MAYDLIGKMRSCDVAQWLSMRSHNAGVVGSNPARFATTKMLMRAAMNYELFRCKETGSLNLVYVRLLGAC